MPPPTVKRGGAASGTRRALRTTKRAQSHQQEASPVVEEPVKAGEVTQDVVIEEAKPRVEDKPVEEKLVIDEKFEEEKRNEAQVIAANGSAPVTSKCSIAILSD